MITHAIDYIGSALKDKGIRVFICTAVFLCVLFFVHSNTQFFFASLLYVVALWKLVGNLTTAIFLGFLVCLPFPKGKTATIELYPMLASMGIKGNITGFLAVSVSDMFSIALAYMLFRRVIIGTPKHVFAGFPVVLFGSVICISVISALVSVRPDIAMLGSVQLLRLLLAFITPVTLEIGHIPFIVSAISASVVFEAVLAGLQMINGGYMGRYIESVSSVGLYGKRAWEDPNLLRVSGTFSDPDLLGVFLFTNLILVSVYLLRGGISSRSVKNVLFVTIIAAVTATAFTGNRGIYGLIAVFMAWSAILYREQLAALWASVNRTLKIIFGVLILATLPYVYTRLQNIELLFSESGSGTFRIQMAQHLWNLGAGSVLGTGLGLSPYYAATAQNTAGYIFGAAIPHTMVLQIFAEMGMAGVVVFGIFVYVIFRPYVVPAANKLRGLPWAMAALGYLLCAQLYPLFINAMEVASIGFVYLGLAYRLHPHET